MKKIVLLLSFVLWIFLGFSQTKPDIQTKAKSDTDSVEKLQHQEIKNNSETGEESLEAMVKRHETTLKESELLLSNWKMLVGGTLGIATFYGIWLYFYGIKKQADKIYEAKLEKRFTDRYSDMIEILKSYDIEKNIKEKYKITLITHKDDNGSYPREILSKNGIKFTEFTRADDLSKITIEKDLVVMVNNEANKWTVAEIENYFSTLDNYTFYYGLGIIKLPSDKQRKFGAANIKTQLVGNLMNLLKYN